MRWKWLLPLFCALLPTAWLKAQEVTFQASVDRNEITTGEPIRYTIELTNVGIRGGLPAPDFGGLSEMQRSSENNSPVNINGQLTRYYSRTWYLTATQAGTYTIGAASIRVGNAVLNTDPITIQVAKDPGGGSNPAASQGQRRDQNLFCTITLSKNKAYVGEQVIATYTVYSRYNQTYGRGSEMPKLSGFWAEDVDLGTSRWEPALQTVNGLQYRVAVLKKQVLIPLRSGKLTVPPMTSNFLVNPSFFSSGTQVQIQSNSTELTVMELPPGKPADFIGAVGELRMEVKAPARTVEANEAIDVAVRFQGRANLKLVDAPKLVLPPDFETYDPKITDQITVNGGGMSGSREFQYLLIPRNEGLFDLGSLTFSYFDPKTATYKQVRSEPLVFEVLPGAGGPGAVGGPSKVDVQRLGSDIRYIRTGDLQLKPAGSHLFGSLPYLLGMAVPPALLLLLFVWRRRREKRLGDAQGQRRRGADRVARKRLELAKAALDKQDREAFNEAIGKALEGYFADKFNLGVAEVNAGTIHQKLDHLDEGATAKEFLELMNEAQMARFAPVGGKPNQQMYEEASTIISRIESKYTR